MSNITATADNPLVLNFSFLGLGKDKEMGIANLVIEGQLVGAATQVTKYVLTTQVLPSAEAGSITREPELEQYKEGATVTLKATKNFGYRFKEWQDATGAVVSTDATTTVTMDAEKTMKAVFIQRLMSLSVLTVAFVIRYALFKMAFLRRLLSKCLQHIIRTKKYDGRVLLVESSRCWL